jgi:hypothetical protein
MSEPKTYMIPCTVVSKGRVAYVQADSRKEALRKFRDCDWEELSDSENWKVTKTGPIVELT